MDIATDGLGRGDGVQGSAEEVGVVVVGNDENGHQITFASFLSFSTSSATDLTLMPA